MIEDEEENKFGGYFHEKILKLNSYVNDQNAFIISLKSNGRLNRIMKFDIIEDKYQHAFCIWNDNNLFNFGSSGSNIDVRIEKEENKNNLCIDKKMDLIIMEMKMH